MILEFKLSDCFCMHDLYRLSVSVERLNMCASVQTVKMGVQYSLWGGSVMNLGTERHKQQYFEDIDKYRLPGGPVLTCLYRRITIESDDQEGNA